MKLTLKYRPRYSPIGLELDDRMVRAAQLVRSSSAWSLAQATEFALPVGHSPIEAAMLIRQVLQRRDFQGDRLSVCVPASLLQSDLLEVPAAQVGQAADDLVGSMFAKVARCPAEAIEVAHWRRENSPTVFAVALAHEVARGLVIPLEEAGFDVLSLGCTASAVARLLFHVEKTREPTAVLRLGYDAHVIILQQGGDVIYQRSLDSAGWKTALPGAAPDEPLPFTDPAVRRHLTAVVEEAATTLECVPRTFPNLSIREVLVSGASAEEEAVGQALTSRLGGVKVISLESLSSVPCARSFDVACGMVLSEGHP